MRSRTLLFFLLAVAGSLSLPLAAHATGIPYFGPIVPTNASTCAAGWDSIVQLVNNAIAVFITLAMLAIAPIMIAYSGFLYVVNPVKPEGRSEANKILMNTIVGIVIALAGWLIVDAILTALTSRDLTSWTSGMFGNGLAPCLAIRTDIFNPSGGQTTDGGLGTGGNGAAGASNIAVSISGSGACDPTVVAQGAQAGGYTISNSESQVLACLARYESGCGVQNKNLVCWNKDCGNGSASSAAGAFQVLLAANSSAYDNNACDDALGLPHGTALNCKAGFNSHGYPIAGSPVVDKCVQAAGNIPCSAAAIAKLLGSNPSYSTWSAAYGTSAKDMACVTQYSH